MKLTDLAWEALKAVTTRRQKIAFNFWRKHGRWPNLRHPKTFNEKLAWMQACATDPQLVTTSDKVAARDYVAERIGDSYLTRLYGVWANAADIDFGALPSAYVLKANHGSGWVALVPDSSKANIESLRAKCAGWLATAYPCKNEWWYGPIKPLLMAEEFLGSGGVSPSDYKFFVFHGEVAMVQVDLDRFTGHRRNLYDPQWNRLPVEYKVKGGPDVPQPDNLDEMLAVASKLGADFNFVRVDLYSLPGRVVFGELSHTPESGWGKFSDPKFDLWLGSLMKHPIAGRRG